VQAQDVNVNFTSTKGWFGKDVFHAVRDATLELKRGETLGIVVDALHADRQLDQHPVVQRHVGFADRLLLAKCDLVEAAAISALSGRLRCINPRAPQQLLRAAFQSAAAAVDGGRQLTRVPATAQSQACNSSRIS
jgi:G3E family GTPase